MPQFGEIIKNVCVVQTVGLKWSFDRVKIRQ